LDWVQNLSCGSHDYTVSVWDKNKEGIVLGLMFRFFIVFFMYRIIGML